MTAIIAIALGMVSLVPLTAAVVAAQDAPTNHGDGTVEEQQFVAKINDLRASKGLPTLAIDGELTTQARIWSTTMKNAGNIFHSQDLSAGITADWQKLGENVGVGGTVGALFDAFVASPKHYENLVDPMYRSIGIGVVWDGDRMFTAHRFMGLFPSSPAPKPADADPAQEAGPGLEGAFHDLAARDRPSDHGGTPGAGGDNSRGEPAGRRCAPTRRSRASRPRTQRPPGIPELRNLAGPDAVAVTDRRRWPAATSSRRAPATTTR